MQMFVSMCGLCTQVQKLWMWAMWCVGLELNSGSPSEWPSQPSGSLNKLWITEQVAACDMTTRSGIHHILHSLLQGRYSVF